MSKDQFPKEFLLKIDGEDHRVGKLTLNKHHDGFSIDIDIVLKENQRIWHHVDSIYGIYEEREAIETGVFKLGQFLKGNSCQ